MQPELCYNGSPDSPITLILAHGAGAPMDSPFMTALAEGFAEKGVYVARFEFPYMAKRRIDGGKKPPDRQPVLLDCWRSVISASGGGERVFIGGKSMGGRMATLIADEVGARGLLCFGYPFHPPGKPDRLRTEHLQKLTTPALFLQGERDPFGKREEVPSYTLSSTIAVHWIGDGDHSLKPRVRSGRTEAQNIAEAVEASYAFMRQATSG